MDAVILAGGENTRMPFVKAFLEIGGKKIIESNLQALRSIFNRVFISTNNPELFFYLEAHLIGDIIKSRGPMAGIFSSLIVPGVSEVFVTACDMPFINVILIRYMADKWDGKHDALIPMYRGKPEPLFGIYSGKVVTIMEKDLRAGRKGLQDFLRRLQVLYIPEKEVKAIDPDGRSFANINTMEDLIREGGGICSV
ncbi:MAG: molybdenum cofactor guanylyltransferase [Nitrospirota bacterium]